MIEWIENLHWTFAILFFWAGAILRSSVIYAIGRGTATGSNKFLKSRHFIESPLYLRAQSFINKWGILAIPLCFLTVGFQTAVILTTGLSRMPLSRWIPAMLVGSFFWGVIYGTVGMAFLWAWLQRPMIATAMVVLLLTIIVILHLIHRSKSR